MNAIVGSILRSFLKDYIQPEALKSLSISVSGGEFKLTNLQVRPEALDHVLSDLPFGLRHGIVGSLTLSIPGGLSGLISGRAFTEPVRLVVDNVHLLVDRVAQTPVEVERKRATNKHAGLDFDAAAYRQQVLDRLLTELEARGAAAASSSRGASGWAAKLESVARNLQVEVNNFHIRFEDVKSQPEAPFACGLTFACFTTAGSSAAVPSGGPGLGAMSSPLASPTPTPGGGTPLASEAPDAAAARQKQQLQHRQARMTLLTLYLDPLSRTGSFQDMAPEQRAAAFSSGITTQAQSPDHHFILAPTSPSLQLTYNPGGRVAGLPLLRVQLVMAQLRSSVTQRQYHSALYLQKWLVEDAGVQLLRSLRARHRPAAPPRADPKAWFRFAVYMYLGLVKQKRDPGVPRWSPARVRGSMQRRRAYIAAYRRLLELEEAAMRKAVGKGGAGSGAVGGTADAAAGIDFDKAVDAPTARTLAELEASLLYEQVLEYRSEARLDYEGVGAPSDGAAAGTGRDGGSKPVAGGAAGGAGGGWWGWMTGGAGSGSATAATVAEQQPSLLSTVRPGSPDGLGNPPPTPSAGSSSFPFDRSDILRRRFEEAKRGTAGSVQVELQAELRSASFALESTHGHQIIALGFAGNAAFTQFKGRSWRMRVQMLDARATDGSTVGCAYAAVMMTHRGPSAGESSSSGSAGSLPLLDISAEAYPLGQPAVDYAVTLASQPLILVFSPRCVRATAAFLNFPAAVTVGQAVGAQLAALSVQTGADVYGVLAQHQRIALDARISGPVIILPQDVCNAGSPRLVLHLGDLSFSSTTAPGLIQPPDPNPSPTQAAASNALVRVPSTGVEGAAAPSPRAAPSHSVADELAAYDSWRLQLSNVAAYMQNEQVGRASAVFSGEELADYGVFSRTRHAIIEPVALELLVQTAVLPESQAANRLRFQGRLPRLAVLVSLPFALRLGSLRRQLEELAEGMEADATALRRELEASAAAAAASGRAASAEASITEEARAIATAARAAAATATSSAASLSSKGLFGGRRSTAPPAGSPSKSPISPGPRSSRTGAVAATGRPVVLLPPPGAVQAALPRRQKPASAGVGPGAPGPSASSRSSTSPTAGLEEAGGRFASDVHPTAVTGSAAVGVAGDGGSAGPREMHIGIHGTPGKLPPTPRDAASSFDASPATLPHSASFPQGFPSGERRDPPSTPASSTPRGGEGVSKLVADLCFDELRLELHDVRSSARCMLAILRDGGHDGAVDHLGVNRAATGGSAGLLRQHSTGEGRDTPQELIVTLRSLRAGVGLSTRSAVASLSLLDVEVVDRYQRAGPSFERLVHTQSAVAIGGGNTPAGAPSSPPGCEALVSATLPASTLIQIHASYRKRPNRAAGEVPVALDIRFNNLHVGYNPETVAACQLYALFLQHCAMGASGGGESAKRVPDSPAAGSRTPSLSTPTPHTAAAASSARGESYLSAIAGLVAADDESEEGGEEEHRDEGRHLAALPAQQLAAAPHVSPLPASAPDLALRAELGTVTLSMHKERERRVVGVLGLRGFSASVAQAQDGLVVDARLHEVYLRDCGVRGTRYPLLLSLSAKGGEDSGRGGGDGEDGPPVSSLAVVRFISFAHPDDAGLRTYDSHLHGVLGPLQGVYLQSRVREVAGFLMEGVLGTVVSSAVASAGAALSDSVQHGASRLLLNVELKSPTVFVPVSPFSAGAACATIGGVTVSNEFISAAPSSRAGLARRLPDAETIDRLSVNLTALTLATRTAEEGEEQVTVDRPSVSALILRPLAPAPLPGGAPSPPLSVSVDVGRIQLDVSKSQLDLVLRVVDSNLARSGGDSQALAQGGNDDDAATVPEGVRSMAALTEEEDALDVRASGSAPSIALGERASDSDKDGGDDDDEIDLGIVYSFGASPAAPAGVAPAPPPTPSAGSGIDVLLTMKQDSTLRLFDPMDTRQQPRARNLADSPFAVFSLLDLSLAYQVPQGEDSSSLRLRLGAVVADDCAAADPRLRRVIGPRAAAVEGSAGLAIAFRTAASADGAGTDIEATLGALNIIVDALFLARLLRFTQLPAAPAPTAAVAPVGSAIQQRCRVGSAASAVSVRSADSAGKTAAAAATSPAAPVVTQPLARFTLSAHLQGVTLLLPTASARSRGSSASTPPAGEWIAAYTEAHARYVTEPPSPPSPSPASTDRLPASTHVSAEVRSLWLAVLPVGAFEVPSADSEDGGGIQSQRLSPYILRPASLTASLDMRDTGSGSSGGGGGTRRGLSVVADHLGITIGRHAALGALGAWNNIVASGVLGATDDGGRGRLTPSSGPASTKPGGSAVAPGLPQPRPVPTALPPISDSPHPPTAGATVTDTASLRWKGLILTVLDASAERNGGGEAAAAARHPPAGLLRASVEEVELSVSGENSVYALQGAFAVALSSWSPATTAAACSWQPVITQPWPFHLRLAQCPAPSPTVPALSVDLEATGPLDVVLLDSTLHELTRGVARWSKLGDALLSHALATSASGSSSGAGAAAQVALSTTPAAPLPVRVVSSAVTELSLSAVLRIPLVAVELAVGAPSSMEAAAGASSGREAQHPLIRVALLGADVSFQSFSVHEAGATGASAFTAPQRHPSSPALASETCLRIRASALQAFDCVNAAAFPGFGLLCTSTPDRRPELEAASTLPRALQLRQLQAQRAELEAAGAPKLVDIEIRSVSREASAATRLPDAIERKLGRVPSRVQVAFHTLHVDWNVETIARTIALLSRIGGGAAAVEEGEEEGRVITTISPAPSPSAEGAAAPSLLPPSAAPSLQVHVVVDRLSLSMNRERQSRKVGMLEVRHVIAGVLMHAEDGPAGCRNGTMLIDGSVADIRLSDTCTRNTRYVQLLGGRAAAAADAAEGAPAAGEGALEEPAAALVAFSVRTFEPGCDVPASVCVQADVAPVDVVYLHAQTLEIVDYVMVGILGALSSGGGGGFAAAGTSPPVPSPPLTTSGAPSAPTPPAPAPSPASSVTSLRISLASPRVLIPVSALDASAFAATLTAVTLTSAVEPDRPVLNALSGVAAHVQRLRQEATASSTGAEGAAAPAVGGRGAGGSSGVLPVAARANVISVALSGLQLSYLDRVGAGPPSGADPSSGTTHEGSAEGGPGAPMLGPLADELTVHYASHLDRHVAAHHGADIGVAVPALSIQVSQAQYVSLRKLLDFNLGAQPLTLEDDRASCFAEVAFLSIQRTQEFDPTAEACTVCSAPFQCGDCCGGPAPLPSRLGRLACEVCGGTVCGGCSAGKLYDTEAEARLACCSRCAGLVLALPPWQVTRRAGSPAPRLQAGTGGGPPLPGEPAPMSVRVSLSEVELRLVELPPSPLSADLSMEAHEEGAGPHTGLAPPLRRRLSSDGSSSVAEGALSSSRSSLLDPRLLPRWPAVARLTLFNAEVEFCTQPSAGVSRISLDVGAFTLTDESEHATAWVTRLLAAPSPGALSHTTTAVAHAQRRLRSRSRAASSSSSASAEEGSAAASASSAAALSPLPESSLGSAATGLAGSSAGSAEAHKDFTGDGLHGPPQARGPPSGPPSTRHLSTLQLHLGVASYLGGVTRVDAVLHGCDFNPELSSINRVTRFFTSYQRPSPLAESAPLSPEGAGLQPTGNLPPALPPSPAPTTRRAPLSRLVFDMHIAHPRVLLLRNPADPRSDMFVASLIGQLKTETIVDKPRGMNLTGVRQEGLPEGAMPRPILRGTLQDTTTSTRLNVLQLELNRTRFNYDPVDATVGAIPCFGTLRGPRLPLLRPTDILLEDAQTATAVLPLRASAPAPAEDDLDPLLCVAVKRVPPSRGRTSLLVSSPVTAQLSFLDCMIGQAVLARYFGSGGGGGSASAPPRGAPEVHAPAPPTHPPPAHQQLAASAFRSCPVCPQPRGWHVDDYEVVLPEGVQVGLRIEESTFGGSGGRRGEGDLLLAGVVATVDTDASAPPTAVAASLPRFDSGDGLRPQRSTPAGATGVIVDGDVLLSVNNRPLVGLSKAQAVEVIRAVRGPRLLRLRAMTRVLVLECEGMGVTIVNNMAGRDEDILRLSLAQVRVRAHGDVSRLSLFEEAAAPGALPPPSTGPVNAAELDLPPGALATKAQRRRSVFASVPVAHRPALASLYATASISALAVDVIVRGVPQPLVEPFHLSARVLQLDRQDAAMAAAATAFPALSSASSSFSASAAHHHPHSSGGPKSRPSMGSGAGIMPAVATLALQRPVRAWTLVVEKLELNIAYAYIRTGAEAWRCWNASGAASGLTDAVADVSMDRSIAHVADAAVPMIEGAPVPPAPLQLQLPRGPAAAPAAAASVLIARDAHPRAFPCVLRNETGVPIAVAVRGHGRWEATVMYSGVSPRAPPRSSAPEAGGGGVPPSHQLATAVAQLNGIELPPEAEVGFVLAPDRQSIGMRAAHEGPSGASGSRRGSTGGAGGAPPRSLALYLEGMTHVLGGVPIPVGRPQRVLEHAVKMPVAGHPGVPLQVPIYSTVREVDGRCFVTLRSGVTVHNYTEFELEVFAALPGAPGGRVAIGTVPSGGAKAVPVPLTCVSGLMVRPRLPPPTTGGGAAAYGLSPPIPLHRPDVVEVACLPLGAPRLAGTGGGAPPFYLVARLSHVSGYASGRGAAYMCITLHAPVRLTNLLPVRTCARLFARGGGGGGVAATAAAHGYGSALFLQPGETLNVHSVSGGGAGGALLLPDGSKSSEPPSPPLLAVATEGYRWCAPEALVPFRGVGGALLAYTAVLEMAPAGDPAAGGTGSAATVSLKVQATLAEGDAAPPAGSASAASGGWELVSRSSLPSCVSATLFAPTWLVNLTGLPLVYGQRVGGDGDVVPAGTQGRTLQVCDQCFENERYYGPLIGWRDPLPTDRGRWTDEPGRTPLSREDVERSLQKGWVWCSEWECTAWDHDYTFSKFSDASGGRTPAVPEKRVLDNVRRRKWYRVRQLQSAGPLDAATTGELPGLPPGSRLSFSFNPRAPNPRILSGSSSIGAVGTTDPRHVVMFTPEDQRSLFVRFGASTWDSVRLNASGGRESQTVTLEGPRLRTTGSVTVPARTLDASMGYQLVAVLSEAPEPFRSAPTQVVSFHPRILIVNATSQPLYYRQMGNGDSPIATQETGTYPEQELPAYSHGPLWTPHATSTHWDEKAAPTLQFSPAAARGGWSPPVDIQPDARRLRRDLPVAITIPEGGGSPPYVRTLLGVTPLASFVMGVSVRLNAAVPGATLVIITQQSQCNIPLRPPMDVLTGPPAEREAAAFAAATDIDLRTAAEARKAAVSAAAAAARHNSVGGAKGSPAGPSSASSPAQQQQAPATDGGEYVAPPYIAVVNHSRCVVAFHQKQPRVFSHTGVPLTEPAAEDSLRTYRSLRASGVPFGLADPSLGALYAAAIHYVNPRCVVPVGLVDPDPRSPAGDDKIRLTMAVMDPSAGILAPAAGAYGPAAAGVRHSSSGSGAGMGGGSDPRAAPPRRPLSRGARAFGEPRVLDLDLIEKPCFLPSQHSAAGVVALVVVSGLTKSIVFYDDEIVRSLPRFIGAPGGSGMNASPSSQRRGSGSSWEVLDLGEEEALSGGLLGSQLDEDQLDALSLTNPFRFGSEMSVQVDWKPQQLAPAPPQRGGVPAVSPSLAPHPTLFRLWDDVGSVEVTSLGVSLIDARPEEDAYLSVSGLLCGVVSRPREVAYKVELGDLELDDTGEEAAFPVVVARQLRRPGSSASSSPSSPSLAGRQPFFLLSVCYVPPKGDASAAGGAAAGSTTAAMPHFRTIDAGMCPVRASVSLEFISKLGRVVGDMMKEFRSAGASSSSSTAAASAARAAARRREASISRGDVRGRGPSSVDITESAAGDDASAPGAEAGGARLQDVDVPASVAEGHASAEERVAAACEALAGVTSEPTFRQLAVTQQVRSQEHLLQAARSRGLRSRSIGTAAPTLEPVSPTVGTPMLPASPAQKPSQRASASSGTQLPPSSLPLPPPSGPSPSLTAVVGRVPNPSTPPAGLLVGAAALPHKDTLGVIEALVLGSRESSAFVERILVAPLDLRLDFKITGQEDTGAGPESKEFIPPWLSLLGVAVTDAPLRLDMPYQYCVIFSPSTYFTLAQGLIRQQVFSQKLGVFFSVDIVGIKNPVALFKNVRGGVVTGLDKAKSGLAAGDPMQAFLGVGTALTSTVSSLAGSASGVTGFMSDTLGRLSGDAPRASSAAAAAREKPSNVLSGLQHGVSEVASGFMGGLSGLITKPQEGFQRGGMVSGLRGMGQGLVGIVAKPVAGIAGGMSRVLQGVEGQLQSREVTEALVASSQPLRIRRAFYGRDGVIRPYDEAAAKLRARLRTLTTPPQPFAEENLVHAVELVENSGAGPRSGAAAGTALSPSEAAALAAANSALLVLTAGHFFVLRGDNRVENVQSLADVQVAEHAGARMIVHGSFGSNGFRCPSSAAAERMWRVFEEARQQL